MTRGLLIALAGLAGGLLAAQDETPAGIEVLRPIDPARVTLAPGLWADRLETNRRVTVPFVLGRCLTTGRIANFARAAVKEKGGHQGYFFNDSDVYKAIEGAARTLAVHPDPALETRLDGVIALIAEAQLDDGYLNTYFTLVPEPRWGDIAVKHELYCAGHLFEAAAVHHRVTGKRTLLDVAVRFADHILRVFGPEARREAPGHEEVEIGLLALAAATGRDDYRALARFFVEERGHARGRKLHGAYAQDHLPVRLQTEAVGHAVRAGYLYTAMADLAAVTGDRSYLTALETLWRDVVGRKLYLTGGIGSERNGEAFGAPYDLRNETAYAETCAAIANAFWNHRMLLLTGDGRYGDVLERVLYNGFLAGVSLSGDRFFYPNPLAADGRHPFNHGTAEREPWFACACCPVNVVRFVPQVPGMAYATGAGSVSVNLYVAGTARLEVGGTALAMVQETAYPWDGEVTLRVEPAEPLSFDLRLRIPGWARGEPVPSDLYRALAPEEDARIGLEVNGEPAALEIDRGYVRLRRQWTKGDRVRLVLPMGVRRVVAHESVKADRGRVAVERGPLVYCVEGVDHGGDVRDLALPDGAALAPERRPDLLGGTVVLTGAGLRRTASAAEEIPCVLVPYPLWGHRGTGAMAVWLPRRVEEAAIVAPPALASRSRATASHCYGSDTIAALHDGILPEHSGDQAVPRLTFWDHTGTTEWVEYRFPKATVIREVSVYWFDDTGVGRCRVPRAWRVVAGESDVLWPVDCDTDAGTARDAFNTVRFTPMRADWIRLEIDLAEGFSGGILEWEVR